MKLITEKSDSALIVRRVELTPDEQRRLTADASSLYPKEPTDPLHGLRINEYQLPAGGLDVHANIRLVLRDVLSWAIVDGDRCFNRDGKWEWEPRPSARDDAFYTRCRWATAEEAALFWRERNHD